MATRRHLRSSLVLAAVACLLVALAGVPAANAGVPTCLGKQASIVGTGANETLRGTSGIDVIVGRGGNDLIIGRAGGDFICGSGGNDTLKGGGGEDRIDGQGGDDEALGGADNDQVLGGGGDDTLVGGAGDDNTDGGPGFDVCQSAEGLFNCEDPPPPLDVDGAWEGTTSQAKVFVFQVGRHTLERVRLGYAWSGSGCEVDLEFSVVFDPVIDIVDDAFTVDTTSDTLTLQASGTFTSETEANGTFSISNTGGDCPGSAEGTWTATKT